MKNIVSIIDSFYKYAQSADEDLERENQAVRNRQAADAKIDSYIKPFLEKLFDNGVNSAPQDIDKIIVDFLMNVKLADKPKITISIKGNSPDVTSWAKGLFSPVNRVFLTNVNKILQATKATPPYDSDFKLQRVYE